MTTYTIIIKAILAGVIYTGAMIQYRRCTTRRQKAWLLPLFLTAYIVLAAA